MVFWNNKLLIAVVVFIAIILIAGGLIIGAFLGPQNQNKNSSNTVEIKITSGMGVKEIALELYRQKAINSLASFQIYSLFTGQARSFKPGIYEIAPNLSLKEITKILTQGPPEISIVIFPGMTLKEADNLLSSKKIISPYELSEFKIDSIKNYYPFLSNANSLEGFIYPDTYNFLAGTDIKKVAITLLDNFKEKINPYTEKLNQLSLQERMNKIILASILEKETTDQKDKEIIAGILEKRLKNSMPLQVDATIIYAKCLGKFLSCPALSRSDFKNNSPFNTYLYKGLPPAPISNPEISSIEAALNPVKTEYWYYLSDPITKKTFFSKTFEEQNIKRAKYLKLF